ncbi:F-box only protein 38-like [Mercenaria mercenaria]|uniref:F-box only protein 38-like n=1 Tax=Mercenaria mercenaria TaxID=6596 RepID=UPI00234EC4B9|nr:F-box only protein 38-like [Mercenaria mercenaria]XP_053381488.1 F-box only protein 38-like [Mercenaria mercenaria]
MGRRRKTDNIVSDNQVPGTSRQRKTHGLIDERKPGTGKVKGRPSTRKDVSSNLEKLKKNISRRREGGRKLGTRTELKRSRSRESGAPVIHEKNVINAAKRNMVQERCYLRNRVVATSASSPASVVPSAAKRKKNRKTSNFIKKTKKRGKKSGLVKDRNDSSKSKVGTKRKRKSTESASYLDGGISGDERPCKRSRTQLPATVTTRSMRAKKVGVTRFIFDKVCNCSENVYFSIFTDGGLIRGCPCGKRYEQFMKLTGGFETFLNRDASGKDKKSRNAVDYFNVLSVEMICYIFQYLTLKEMLRFESLSKKLQKAVQASLSIREEIDFNEDVCDKRLFENNLPNMTNKMFSSLLSKLPRLRFIYNFHPANISSYLNVSSDVLTVAAVVDTLVACKSLEGIEISNMDLLENIVSKTSHPKIIGKFQNRNPQFPVLNGSTTVLKDDSRITNLHLVGCSVYYMPQMDSHLEHLYLRMVKFVHHHPFKDFSACKLKTFVMSHCIGPSSALKYIPLLSALAEARGLKRLELQRVPVLGGVIQHLCEDNWQDGGFRRLNSITMGECKNALDVDLGFLIIAAAAHIEALRIQPSLTKDAVFSALAIADVTINPGFEELCLGWKEAVPFNENWTNAELVAEGLADLPESQSRITDSGMRLVGQCFQPLKKLEIHNCPNLINPLLWLTPGQHYLRHIRDLTLENCHSMRVEKFCAFLTFLPELRYLTLREIFKEPPLGCSRVGLSAGTGLGISAALINPQPLVNNPGGLNNNDDDDAADNAAVNGANDGAIDNNPPAEQGQGDNRGEDDGIENEAANQNGDRGNVANHNAAAEFENQNERYNFRHTSRNASCQTDSEQGSSRTTRSKNKTENSSRKSPRISHNVRSSKTTQKNTNQAACDKNKSLNNESSSDGRGVPVGSKNGVVSKRGKALVTKKGLVSRVKSSKGKGKESDTLKTDAEKENSKVKNGCTCVKETVDIGCQASNDDIRKACSQKSTRKKRAARKPQDKEKIIKAGRYKPSSVYETPRPSPSCPLHHGRKRSKPSVADKCDSTNDPVWEEDHSMVLTILHRRLEYLKIDAVGITELNVVCYNLQTLSVSRCRVLKYVKLKEAPFLENVHVSQCRKVNESNLLDEIYRLPPNRSKFVSLRPLHYVDESLYDDLMFFGDFQHYNFGTVMTFDYSDKPSETNYNKLRMKSWISMLERMTTMTMMDHGWQRFHEMEHPNKGLVVEEGDSSDGSKWKMYADIPWIGVLSQCPDMEEQNIKDPDWMKPGVYSMEAKGHFSFWDAYADVQDYVAYMGPDQGGLYECNVLTYVNMCDISGVPTQDALKVL